MSQTYNLNPPLVVGDADHQVTVNALKIVSISANYENAYAQKGVAILSVCLADPVSGYKINVVYQDASALPAAQTIDGLAAAGLFTKLIADGKLPPGTLAS